MSCFKVDTTTKKIDQKLIDDSKNSKEIKLLLLGAGESGKSTLFKQMKIIHHEGYTPDESVVFKDVIRSNILQSMKSLVTATQKLNIEIESKENQTIATKISQFDQESLLNIAKIYNEELGKELECLWKDKGIQEAYEKRSQFQLLDSTEYFFNNIQRISEKDYVPNQADILRCRVKTTGIVETDFTYNKLEYKLYDVGGQRNERKKWIHCFDNVSAVIFVTSLSEYDLKCYEDDSTLRMKESLILFEEICNSRYFSEIPIILFFNKVDLFKEKIKNVDLNVCFKEYQGGKDFDKAIKFIIQQFLDKNQDDNKKITTFCTCATDTDNIKEAFKGVTSLNLNKKK